MIFTFYSFKGGVGRSMALANVADRLARRGLRVLAMDFDLEAPGLERYYPIDKIAALANPGLIDLLRAFKESLAGRGDALETASFRDLSRFVFPIYERVGVGGRLDLLPAGCRSAGEGLRRYALDVRTFDWQDFYYNWEGEAFFEWLRRELTGPQGRYDAVLVDSRTGVTEMGGVCAYQLADSVVMLSAANHQNLLGTLDVARDFRSAPVMALRHGRPLELLVLPARIEQRDPTLLDAFYERFDAAFEGQMPAALSGLSARQLAIPYQPEYAFEEVVVTDPARRDARAGVGVAFERLADALVMLGDGAMAALQPAARAALWPAGAGSDAATATPDGSGPVDAAEAAPREAALNYDPTRRFAGYDAFVSCSADERDVRLADQLAPALQSRGVSAYLDSSALVAGDDWSQATTQALHHSRTLLLCVGAGGLSPWQKRQVELARGAVPPVPVLPVLLAGADAELLGLLLKSLGDARVVDLRGWPEREVEFELLARQLGVRGDPVGPTAPSSAAAADAGFNPYPGLPAAEERHAGLLDLPAAPLEAMLAALRMQHAVLLCGASGSGKTSLVAAGLVPAVRAGALGTPAPVLRRIDARDEPGWLQTLAQAIPTPPQDGAPAELCIVDHIDEHAAALPPSAMASPDDAERAGHARAGAALAGVAQAGATPAETAPGGTTQAGALPGPHPASTRPVAPTASTERAAHDAWVAALNALITHAGERFRLVLIARRGPAGVRAPTVALDTSATQRPRLDLPALRTGMAFEPGLLERIDADVALGPEPLTLGALVLPALWDSARRGFLGNEVYAASGGVAAAYERHISLLLARVPAPLSTAVDSVLLWLLQGSAETAWNWRTSPWERLTALCGWSPAMLQATLWLTHERVLHLAEHDAAWQVAVAGPLPPEQSPAVARLLAEHGAQLRLRGALAFALERWRRAGHDRAALLSGRALADAQQLVDRWRANLTHDMVEFVGASQIAVAEAERQAAADAAAKQTAQAAAQARLQRRSRAVLAGVVVVLMAAAGAFTLWRSSRHEDEVKSLRDRDTALAQQAAQKSAEVRDANARARAAITVAQVTASSYARHDANALRGTRIALQFRSECERGAVLNGVAALTALGARVDAPDLVAAPPDAPTHGDVRYAFERDRAAAEHLQSVLTDFLATQGLEFTPELVDRREQPGAARPGTLEVGLPELSGLPRIAAAASRPGRDGASLKLVPGGCATLGSEHDARVDLMRTLGIRYFSFLDNDRPQEQRWIDAFYISRTEVTNAQFGKYVAQACTAAAEKAAAPSGPASPSAAACPAAWRARGAAEEPARFLGWTAADAYCRQAGGRLPTEDEWEKAARGTDGRIWPWGNQPDAQRFMGKATARQRLAPVGSFPAGDSPYGVADLAGNLWELTASNWDDGGHVMKGGSYLNDLPYVRASSRWASSDEEKGGDYLGFRCVVDYDQVP